METKNYIKKTRTNSGLSQRLFGKGLWPNDTIAKAGDRISKYETGKATPPGDVILRIQAMYGEYTPKIKGIKIG